MADNSIPKGYQQGNKGWVLAVPSSSRKKMEALKQENADLSQRLADLEELVAGLTAKKSKKNG